MRIRKVERHIYPILVVDNYRIASFQDEILLSAPCAIPKPINLEECILCQKKKRSEYLSSGEIGRSNIVSLAKRTKSNDTRAVRVLQLTVQEQGIIKTIPHLATEAFKGIWLKRRA